MKKNKIVLLIFLFLPIYMTPQYTTTGSRGHSDIQLKMPFGNYYLNDYKRGLPYGSYSLKYFGIPFQTPLDQPHPPGYYLRNIVKNIYSYGSDTIRKIERRLGREYLVHMKGYRNPASFLDQILFKADLNPLDKTREILTWYAMREVHYMYGFQKGYYHGLENARIFKKGSLESVYPPIATVAFPSYFEGYKAGQDQGFVYELSDMPGKRFYSMPFDKHRNQLTGNAYPVFLDPIAGNRFMRTYGLTNFTFGGLKPRSKVIVGLGLHSPSKGNKKNILPNIPASINLVKMARKEKIRRKIYKGKTIKVLTNKTWYEYRKE